MNSLNLKIGERRLIGDFNIERISDRYYELWLDEQAVGAGITTEDSKTFNIPFTFGLLVVKLDHDTSTKGTASTDELRCLIRRKKGQVCPIGHFEDYILDQPDITLDLWGVDFRDLGSDGYVCRAGEITIDIFTTATDLIGCYVQIKEIK